ncbi:hypothetical protein ACHAXN_011294 [Cyclotella atomus]
MISLVKSNPFSSNVQHIELSTVTKVTTILAPSALFLAMLTMSTVCYIMMTLNFSYNNSSYLQHPSGPSLIQKRHAS